MIIHDAIQGSAEWHALRHGKLTASLALRLLTPGGEPRMPQYYALSDSAPTKVLRAARQTEILERAVVSGIPIRELAADSGSAFKTLIQRGYLVPCDPPPDAEPIVSPIRLSDQREALVCALLHEWATGNSAEEWRGSQWTEHGHAIEGEAGAWLSFAKGLQTRPVGFITDDAGEIGCSPDLGVFEGDEMVAGVELKGPAGWTHIRWLREHARTGRMPREHVMQPQFSLYVTQLPRWLWMSYAAPLEGYPWREGASLPPLVVEVEPEARYQDAFAEHVPVFLSELAEAREELAALVARGMGNVKC